MAIIRFYVNISLCSKGNKTVPEKVATTRTEDGHKQTAKTGTEIHDQKEDGTLDDRRKDGGTNSTLRTKEQGTHLTLNEHDDDDDDFTM